MDNEHVRKFCLGMPHVAETLNWGHRLVYWAGDREIGGRMFAMTDLDGTGHGVLLFHSGPKRFHELLEVEGVVPSPYLASKYWVTLLRWDGMRAREIENELRMAYELILARLPKRTLAILALPERERRRVIRERKKLIAERERAKKNSAGGGSGGTFTGGAS